MDTYTLSDPMVVMYEKPPGEDWKEVGRTEMIKDCLSPRFVKSFKVPYHFEELQYVRFVCFDVDDLNGALEKQDLIGEADFSLGEIVSAESQSVTKELKLPAHPGRGHRGYICVVAEIVAETSSSAFISLSGEKLDKKDLFGKSDPFFVISRCTEQGSFIPVAKSEVIHKSLNPVWKSMEISLQTICNGDLTRPVKIDVFDWNRSGT